MLLNRMALTFFCMISGISEIWARENAKFKDR
jgi:hypothetical protein